jgi:hypothetical protein
MLTIIFSFFFLDEPLKHYDQGDEVIRKDPVESANPWSDIARQWGKFEYHQYG